MTDLSPAARAVRLAAINAKPGQTIAAALHAAADQVFSSVPPPCADFDEHAKGFLAAHVKYKRDLLAIVAELEGQYG